MHRIKECFQAAYAFLLFFVVGTDQDLSDAGIVQFLSETGRVHTLYDAADHLIAGIRSSGDRFTGNAVEAGEQERVCTDKAADLFDGRSQTGLFRGDQDQIERCALTAVSEAGRLSVDEKGLAGIAFPALFISDEDELADTALLQQGTV